MENQAKSPGLEIIDLTAEGTVTVLLNGHSIKLLLNLYPWSQIPAPIPPQRCFFLQ